MKRSKASGTLGLAVLAILGSPLAMADDSGWYAGANLGQSQATIDDARITGGLLSGGFTTISIADEDRDLGGKIFGGYQFSRNFALEAGYFDLGKFGFKATVIPPGTLSGRIESRGLNLDAIGILPFTEKFSAFARLGVNRAETRDSFTGTGMVNVLGANPTATENHGKFGLGLQYAFTEALSLRAEVERYRIDDAVGNQGDVDLVSFGLVYRFGQDKPVVVARAVTPRSAPPPPPPPVPMAAPAPAAAPAPVLVPVQPPRPAPAPRPVKLTFSADSLFDFDKAIVKPARNRELDQLAADLKGASFDVITVTGHSDRIGSHAYNMKLSLQRAEAVKAYLMQSAGIAAERIDAKGVNGADPVTRPGDCKGVKASKKLIACLQPDRRVDVEVVATKASR